MEIMTDFYYMENSFSYLELIHNLKSLPSRDNLYSYMFIAHETHHGLCMHITQSYASN